VKIWMIRCLLYVPSLCDKSDDRMSRLNRNLNLILLLRSLDIVMLASRRLLNAQQRLGGLQIQYIQRRARVIPVSPPSPFLLHISSSSMPIVVVKQLGSGTDISHVKFLSSPTWGKDQEYLASRIPRDRPRYAPT
jgi:hypothetical protein